MSILNKRRAFAFFCLPEVIQCSSHMDSVHIHVLTTALLVGFYSGKRERGEYTTLVGINSSHAPHMSLLMQGAASLHLVKKQAQQAHLKHSVIKSPKLRSSPTPNFVWVPHNLSRIYCVW